jgi:cytochrome c oxidase subunit 2
MNFLSHNPSMLLDPAGTHAVKTAQLFWALFSVCAIIWILLVLTLLISLWRRRRPDSNINPLQLSPLKERKLNFIVGTAVGLTALILTVFISLSYLTDKHLISLDRNPDVVIEVTAHQWWWELRYLEDTPSKIFITANEIHVPVNSTVQLILKSPDVIHSLWFPNLSGKRDIIPGRDQDMYLHPEREGVWVGRCGEFCGLQHAKMNLKLVVESSSKFDAWKTAQRLPAADPMTDQEKRGQSIFATSSCTMCHSIRRVSSAGFSNNAPDLTHLKSRSTLGAGAAENTKGDLGGWIIDPHGLKPGVHMPTILQEPEQFQALLSYLETLK